MDCRYVGIASKLQKLQKLHHFPEKGRDVKKTVVHETEKARRQAGYFALLQRYGLPFSLKDYRRNVISDGVKGEPDLRAHP